ncbi:uncharacterized protein LOC117253646 isoform X1 [Epinephelus lanceolatus]|uniref:uncharacterized protein LOC117253646 n=1 Tax=Epinephelus lanceolatus TaxID=310571 RepID=UPI001447E96F|nr:uncharacterized protein LOC117253646 [Epinephelus lanceolatus]
MPCETTPMKSQSANMKLNYINWIFFPIIIYYALADLMVAVAAAESQHALTCNVTQLHDGSFRYQLSRPSNSTKCETCWEDHNKTVIALDFDFDRKLVQNLTDQFIILKECKDYLHYTKACKVWEEAHCKVNCTRLLSLKDPPLNTVNSTLFCITESWCLTQLNFGLGIAGIVLLLSGISVVLYCWNRCKCRGREFTAMRASYTPATLQIQRERDDVVVIKIPQDYTG